jgi:hypothetical protein
MRKNAKTGMEFAEWDNIVRTKVYMGEKNDTANELEQLLF